MKFWESRSARILLLLLLIAPPLFVGLDVADCEFHMEVRTLAAAQETWIRQQTDPDAWLIPSWNGAPRVNKPPLTVWFNMLVWTGLDPASASVDQLVHRARLAAAALSLIAILAIGCIGSVLRDDRYGLLAAAITGTCLLFLRNARMASYDSYLLVFSTLSLAGALVAMRPGHTDPPRFFVRAAGWLACGVAMALAFLTKGPIALVMTAAPIAVLALSGERRRADGIGLACAMLAALALAAPWYLYVLRHVPAADRIMGTEFRAARSEFQPPWYYLGLIGLVAPWSLHLAAAVWGFARRHLDRRAAAIRVSAIWFAVIFLIMSIPSAKQQRYIIPILPAAGLLMTALFTPSLRGTWTGPLRATRVLAWGLLILSVVIAVAGVAQPNLLALGWLRDPIFVRFPPVTFTLLALPLAWLAWQMLKRARADRLESAAWYAAAWMTLLATPALYDYSHSKHGRYAERSDVETVRAIVGDAPFYHIVAAEAPDHLEWPDPKMLLYGRRTIPAWTGATPEPGAWLMAMDDEKLNRTLRRSGWQPVRAFHDGNSPRQLYHAP